ncbi:MAG: hypothetical protein Q8T13_21340 [Acidobacteriota bacterium]|nr:hypothetical protein [Acidobacteriota bacterium]
MRSRIIVGSLVFMASLTFGLAATRTAAEPALKWAAVNLKDTTVIAGAFVSGPVIFVHDDAKMAQGGPCTSVHRFEPGKGVGEQIVAFHCKPRWTQAPGRFTSAIASRADGPPVMTEYQFAGDAEAHGVPQKAH